MILTDEDRNFVTCPEDTRFVMLEHQAFEAVCPILCIEAVDKSGLINRADIIPGRIIKMGWIFLVLIEDKV